MIPLLSRLKNTAVVLTVISVLFGVYSFCDIYAVRIEYDKSFIRFAAMMHICIPLIFLIIAMALKEIDKMIKSERNLLITRIRELEGSESLQKDSESDS